MKKMFGLSGKVVLVTGATRNPEDLTADTLFLGSRASDFVNGKIIYVDGGILATIGKPSLICMRLETAHNSDGNYPQLFNL